MPRIFDKAVSKRSANSTVNSVLSGMPRGADVNLSATLDEALTRRVIAAKRVAWLQDNMEAIVAFNELLNNEGVFSDGVRSF